MKKYKLIRKYPGSPELGTEIEKRTVYSEKWMFKKDCNLFPVTSGTPDDYPEFWEEVVEKDYEILSYYAKNISGKGDYCVDYEYIWYETSKGNGKWSRKGHITIPYTTDEINNHNGYGIHSVKRLSDEEIFTVGDVSNFGKITDFVIRENKIVVQYYKIGDWQWLSSIKHIKKPLFTTEDGVNIFEGDEFYSTNKNLNQSILKYIAEKGLAHSEKCEEFLDFSTKEAAEEYILMNKPCLSINDVFNIYPKYRKNERILTKHAEELIELVKLTTK